jgi:PAT family beta-lactamase induction signal transducer AmpG
MTANSSAYTTELTKPPHPIVFMFLLIPFGAMTGYLTVTLGYLFSSAGISPSVVLGLAAINLIPQVFKFLWSPLVDVTLSVKAWYIISNVACCICLLMLSIIPIKSSSLSVFTIVVVLSSFAVSFVGIATNSLSAHNTPGDLKGRVSGYLQAGNLGGAAVGGGAGLWLSQHMAHWMAGGILAIAFMLCSLGLLFVKEPIDVVKVKSLTTSMGNVVKDVWATIKKKAGIIALILCLLPLGSGAAGGSFSAIAKEWKASADIVALVMGLLGGCVTAVGCLIGGWLCDLMDRKWAYIIVCLLQAVSAVGMAFFPHNPTNYIIWTLFYSFTNGLAYAAFNAFTLEVIGKGAAATKFELYASVSNAPIYMMTAIASFAYAKLGSNGMLYIEALFALVAAVLYVIIKTLIERNRAIPETAEFIPEH